MQERPLMTGSHHEEDDYSHHGLFPNDVLMHIFTYLCYNDLVHVCRTCKLWYDVSGDDLLWKPIISVKLPREAVFSVTLNCTVAYKIAKTVDDIHSNYRQTYITLRSSARDIALREDALNAELVFWNEKIYKFITALTTPLLAHVIYLMIIFLAFDKSSVTTGRLALAWIPQPIIFGSFALLLCFLVFRFWRTFHMLQEYERIMHLLGNEVFIPGRIIQLYKGAVMVWWLVMLSCAPVGVTCFLLGQLFSYSLSMLPVYIIMYCHLIVTLVIIAYSVRNAEFYGWMEQGGEFTILNRRVSYKIIVVLFCCFLDAFVPVQIGVACARLDHVLTGNWGAVLVPLWTVLFFSLMFGVCALVVSRLKSRSIRQSRIVRL
jgi:hypothetical protein